MSNSIPVEKPCKRCGGLFPANDEYFHHDQKRLDGLTGICKECAKTKARLWYHEHLD